MYKDVISKINTKCMHIARGTLDHHAGLVSFEVGLLGWLCVEDRVAIGFDLNNHSAV